MNVNDKLLPCPHCGKTETLEFATRRELEDCPNFDDCDAEKCEYGACDYFGTWDCVVCSVIKSGCGATGGYASCPAEAVEKWNTRATVGTLTAEQVREAIKANSWAETSSLDKAAATLAKFGYEKVVRCRDCCHKRRSWNGHEPNFIGNWFCSYTGGHEVKPDGFCAWGERREQ